MDKANRKEIRKAVALLRQVKTPLSQALTMVNDVVGKQLNYIDALSEKEQKSKQGQRAIKAAYQLEDELRTMRELRFDVTDLICQLKQAIA